MIKMAGVIANLNQFASSDVSDRFRAAIAFCRAHPGTTLQIPPGEYLLRDESAVRLMNDAMHGKMGNNPQEQIFTHYYPYYRGFDLSGCRDLTVEGYGVRLICDGWMEPVSIDACQNVTLKGLTIDYLRKPYSVGTVLHADSQSYDVRFPASYPVQAAMPTPRIYQYSRIKSRFDGEGWDCGRKEWIADQTLRFYGDKPDNLAGATICVWHSFHFRPAVFINESTNITLIHVTIHSQPGMGIVGHRSENIVLRNLRIVPAAGEYMSVNTDATHFTSCKGTLCLDACQFEGMGDDAINVHNYYYTIRQAQGKACQISVEDADAHAQVLDYPDPADTLELVEAATLAPVRTYQVESVCNQPDRWLSELILDAPLPDDCTRYYLINTTRLPELKFLNCQVRNHLSRGVLIKTRHVLVEGCTFDRCTGTAIHIAAEGGWREGVPAADVTIRHNRMLGCGHALHGNPLDVSGICVNIDAAESDTPGLHKDILIEDNIIVGDQSACGIYVSCADSVMIRHNEIAACVKPIEIVSTTNTSLRGNQISPAEPPETQLEIVQ